MTPVRRPWLLLPLALGCALLPGCGRLLRAYDVAPSGLPRAEEELRRTIAGGRADSALVQQMLTGDASPGDELLRALYGGVAAYYAGRYEESGALLDVASALADDRVTKSVSRSAFALVTNDLALPYEPSHTERLLIPWYGALAYLHMRDLEGAAVEARRMAALLEAYGEPETPDEQRLHAALRYFAGAVFEAYGDRNDAAVSYRHAAALGALDTVPPAIPADSGDVVVVVAHGFVAHRVEESLNVLLAPDELFYLRDGDPDRRFGFGDLVATRVMAQVAPDGVLRGGPVYVPLGEDVVRAYGERDRCREDRSRGDAPGIGEVLKGDSARIVKVAAPPRRSDCDDDDDAPYLLRVAWPTYRRSSPAPADARVLRAAADTMGAHVAFVDVSAAVVHDYQRELPLIIARTLVRGAAKAAITKGAEKKLEKKNEALGKIVGILGNVGNVLLERADTRSWHLLPGSIGVARVRLAPGEHTLRVQLADGQEVVVERVRVAAGGVSVASARAW